MIRIATPEDAGILLEIYRPYVEETAISFEYEAPGLDEFGQRIENTLERYPYLVLEEAGEIRGYAYAGTFKERAAYQWSVETSIYIKKGYHGRGYGKSLYLKLEEYLKKQHVFNLNACIAHAKENSTHLNNDSEKFHEKMGYRPVGTFHDCAFKFSEWYDMIWMEKMLGEHSADPGEFIPFKNLKPEKEA